MLQKTQAQQTPLNGAVRRANEALERVGRDPISLSSRQATRSSAITDDCSATTQRDVFIRPITINFAGW